MKLAKTLGITAFAFGLIGPMLFYLSPFSFPTYESHVVCPACPCVDTAFATKATWLGLALKFSLFWGVFYGFLGFAIGYCIAMLRRTISRQKITKV